MVISVLGGIFMADGSISQTIQSLFPWCSLLSLVLSAVLRRLSGFTGRQTIQKDEGNDQDSRHEKGANGYDAREDRDIPEQNR